MTRRQLVGAVVGGFVAMGGLIGGVAARGSRDRAALPFYGSRDLTPSWTGTSHRVGPFVMTSQTGARVTGDSLRGRPYVASFIYTQCSSLCPTLVASLKRVQAATADVDLAIVSFSVTPDLDTPAVLAAFGRSRGIDPARWRLLTGDRFVIYRLARDEFFADDLRLQSPGRGGGPDAGAEAFLHTEKLTLVDGEGRLRGVYNGTQPFDVEHLIGDAHRLSPGFLVHYEQ